MLTFDLNNLKRDSFIASGSVSSPAVVNNYMTTNTTPDLIKNFSGGLIPSGVVDTVHKWLGGVDYAKDVAPVMKERIESRLNHVNSVLKDTSLTESERLTKADALLTSYIDWAIYTKATKKSAAWNKGYDVQISTLQNVLDNLRLQSSSSYHIDTSLKDVKPLGLSLYSGNPFKYEKGSVLAYGVYTKKSTVKNVSGGTLGKPIASIPVDNLVPQIIPGVTDSISDEATTSTTDEKKSGGLLPIVLLVVTVIAGFGVYLFKKKKKKK